MMEERRFSVEFVLFEQSRLLTDTEVQLVKRLIFRGKLDKIVREACALSGGKYKLCYTEQDRVMITNKTNTKYLCHYLDKWPWDCLKDYHSVRFHQQYRNSKAAFTVDELTDICSWLQVGLEEFLGRRILYPIISTPLVTYNINPQEPTDCFKLD